MRSSGLVSTPSLQHVVTLMRPSVEATKRELDILDKSVIGFNYFPFDRMAKPLMEGALTLPHAVSQCDALKNEAARKPNRELVSAFYDYVEARKVSWFNNYPRDVFPIAPGVGIPVNPTGFWLDGGRLKVMWVQKWKGRTLDPLQKAIFHTILDRRLFVGDDFGSAELEWIDLRAPIARGGRSIEILNRRHFDILSDAELKAHLDILLEAFAQHMAEKSERKAREKRDRPPAPAPLFDGENPADR